MAYDEGLAEILRTLPSKDAPTIPGEVGRIVPPFRLLAKFTPSAVRSGLLGTAIGAIPGAGANVASFLAYDIGRRRAKPEEQKKWGRGSYEALVCAETANNATAVDFPDTGTMQRHACTRRLAVS